MKIRGLEDRKPFLEDKSANRIRFNCSSREGVPVITEIDLQFRKIGLRSVNVQKNSKKCFL